MATTTTTTSLAWLVPEMGKDSWNVPHSSNCGFVSAGFGSSKKPSKKKQKVSLDTEAQKLLTRHNNDIDAASSDYFHERMKENGSLQGSDLMEARMKATWDTVALFLPYDYAQSNGKTDEYVERRLDLIAKACCAGSILDVGCGDGAIIKYLNANRKINAYSGIDIAPKMIALAKQQHPDYSFEVATFPRSFDTHNGKFDTVLFNGSLQFFQDTPGIITAAFDLLAPGGRIVISHVNGAAFVQQECRTNPLVAVQTMPTEDNLNQIAPETARVFTKTALFDSADLNESDVPDRSFYLLALERPFI